MEIQERVRNLSDELMKLRRDFHMHPELAFEEERTSEIVAAYLENLGLEVKRGIARTAVVGLLRGNKTGSTILLRADMDALPIEEENKVSYRSLTRGKMHACGHDGHTAMLLIAAKVLSQEKDEINGNIKFLFQPAEETGGAIRLIIEEGVLEEPHVDAALGLHLSTQLESGKVGIVDGAMMARDDEFKLTIEGKAGHTGSPQQAIDPIIAAADIITGVQIIQTREMDAVRKPMVIMFGKIEGGTAAHIIPKKVELQGTIRYLYGGGEEDVKRFERIIGGVCRAHRTKYKLEFMVKIPIVDNNPELAELVRMAAKRLAPSTEVVSDVRTTMADDFSELGQKVPSAYYFIGTRNKEKGTDYPHHHPRFNIDEDTLSIGAEMHVRTALSYLSSEACPQ